ncbi:MAG: LLM class flavin-dependent oxidoreductase [Actinomycetota bacterium]
MSGAFPHVGVMLPQFRGETGSLIDAVQEAEELGFASAWVIDHLSAPGADPSRPILESWTALALLAVRTSRIGVGTLVTRAGLRRPGILAKAAATLQQASRGRLTVGVGIGDATNRGENFAYGYDFPGPAERDRRLEETVEALRSQPLGGPSAGRVPVWVGGNARARVDVAARIADGWNSWGLPAAEFAGRARLLEQAALAAGRPGVKATWAGQVLIAEDDAEAKRALATWSQGRDPGAVAGVIAGGPEEVVAGLGALADAGAAVVVCSFVGPLAGRGRQFLAAALQ